MVEGLAALELLVVDDNAQMRTIVGAVLLAAGIGRLHYAVDGRHALEILERTPIDVAYVDYEMPTMNGAQLISEIRGKDWSHRFIPIIVLTGHADLFHLADVRDRGMNEFLCKPVTAKDILLRLDAVIRYPRPFTMTEAYFGPDRRRRRAADDYPGPKRRAADGKSPVEV